MRGLVIKSTGSQYLVKVEEGSKILCRLRGNLRLQDFIATNPLTVGDIVEVDVENEVITDLTPRKNYIIRKSVKLSRQIQIMAANIDSAYIVATPILPRTSLGFIDRVLATAEAYNISGGIIFNKSDLYDSEVRQYVADKKILYQEIGYKVFVVSALQPNTLMDLEFELKDTISLLSGHSGVGKTTLINALIPGLDLKTAEISEQHETGVHTTTFAEMHELPRRGFIIDTPGIREFGTIDFNKHEVSHFFPDIFKYGRNCKFNNCLHVNEKDCAVIEAIEDGLIALSRFQSYLSILGNEDIYR
jgi:ribosome biogenesis GTPase